MGYFLLVCGPYHNETGSSMSCRIGLCFLLLVVPGGCRKATAPAAQGQTGTLSVDECMGIFRDTGRGVAYVAIDDCVELVAKSGDEEAHVELISLASAWARYLDISVKPPEDLNSDSQAADKLYRLNAVITHGLGLLSSDRDLAPKILELLTRMITTTWCSPQAQHQCMQLLGQLDVPEQLRRSAVLEIIEHRRGSGSLSGVLLDLVNPSYFPRLVELVSSSDSPDSFHFGAASALAHCGHQGILTRLNSLRPSFLAKHRNIEGILIYYTWQIEIQNPPEKLLTYIRSALNPLVEQRPWAIRRAVDLGIPSEKIRDAILAYASQVQPNARGIRPHLSSMKKTGQAAGVLKEDDLPDVRTSSPRRRH